MTSKKKPKRDGHGRFADSTQDDSAIAPLFAPRSMWSRFKSGIILLLVVVLGIPWSVLMFEPMKVYSSQFVDLVQNKTSDIKYSLCSCKLPSPDPRNKL